MRGLRLLWLDPKTEKKLSATILDDRDPETGENLQAHVKHLYMPVALPDILSSDGRHIYMRSQGGYGRWLRAGRITPSGRLMVIDDSSIYGFGRKPEFMTNASVLEYQIFAAEKKISEESLQRADDRIRVKAENREIDISDWKFLKDFSKEELSPVSFKWSRENSPLQVWAMVLADKTLFIVGMVDEEQSFVVG